MGGGGGGGGGGLYSGGLITSEEFVIEKTTIGHVPEDDNIASMKTEVIGEARNAPEVLGYSDGKDIMYTHHL